MFWRQGRLFEPFKLPGISFFSVPTTQSRLQQKLRDWLRPGSIAGTVGLEFAACLPPHSISCILERLQMTPSPNVLRPACPVTTLAWRDPRLRRPRPPRVSSVSKLGRSDCSRTRVPRTVGALGTFGAGCMTATISLVPCGWPVRVAFEALTGSSNHLRCVRRTCQLLLPYWRLI